MITLGVGDCSVTKGQHRKAGCPAIDIRLPFGEKNIPALRVRDAGREKESPGTTSEALLCAEAQGALQVLHLATCYFRGGYPGRGGTLQPRVPIVNDRFWCSAARYGSRNVAWLVPGYLVRCGSRILRGGGCRFWLGDAGKSIASGSSAVEQCAGKSKAAGERRFTWFHVRTRGPYQLHLYGDRFRECETKD
jgi:hypothetical protein